MLVPFLDIHHYIRVHKFGLGYIKCDNYSAVALENTLTLSPNRLYFNHNINQSAFLTYVCMYIHMLIVYTYICPFTFIRLFLCPQLKVSCDWNPIEFVKLNLNVYYIHMSAIFMPFKGLFGKSLW